MLCHDASLSLPSHHYAASLSHQLGATVMTACVTKWPWMHAFQFVRVKTEVMCVCNHWHAGDLLLPEG